MGLTEIWYLKAIDNTDTVFTLEKHGSKELLASAGNVEGIGKKAQQRLKYISSMGVWRAMQKTIVVPVRSADPSWYEIRLGGNAWRMFCYKPEDHRAIVVFALFESHKGKTLKKKIKSFDHRFRAARDLYEGRSEHQWA